MSGNSNLKGENTNSKPLLNIIFVLLLLTTSCDAPSAAYVVPTDLPPTPTKVPPPSNSETVQPTAAPSGDEHVYPVYYIPLATKPDIAPQTINGATAMIDWVYVGESRVALHYTISGLNWPDGMMLDATSVQISSTMAENIDYGGYGGSSLPVDKAVTMGSFDQLLIDGAV